MYSGIGNRENVLTQQFIISFCLGYNCLPYDRYTLFQNIFYK